MKNLTTTLLYIIKDGKVLLGEKKRGFGQGYLNGFGGKQQEGETIEECMVRETMEEIGIKPIGLEMRALINFDLYYKGEKEKEKTYVFVASGYEGEIRESEEMKPVWFELQSLPYDKMFSDDIYWLPSLLEGKTFTADIKMDENFKTTHFDINYNVNFD